MWWQCGGTALRWRGDNVEAMWWHCGEKQSFVVTEEAPEYTCQKAKVIDDHLQPLVAARLQIMHG